MNVAIKKMADGQYRIDFRDANGNRYRKLYATRKEADAALADNKVKIRKGEFLAPAKVPNFGEVAQAWLNSRATRRPGTVDNYRRHVTLYFTPKLGNIRLDRIDVQMLEGFRDELRRTLAVSTVRSVMGTLSAIFKFAVRQKNIIANPMLNTERVYSGAVELTGESDAREHHEGLQAVRPEDVLDLSEIRRLIASARPGIYRTLFATAAATGARSGELFALRWSDIEFDDGSGKGRGRVFIRRSLSWSRGDGEKTRARFFEPKTRAGIRTIPIPHEIVVMLKAWKLACPVNEGDLVFPARDGRPMRRSTVYQRGFVPALAAAKLRTVRLHSLRHSFASALIAAGAPVTEVSHLIGHADPGITLKVYSHWFKDAESGSTDRVAAALFGRQDGHLLDTSDSAGAKNA
jgi:integrase